MAPRARGRPKAAPFFRKGAPRLLEKKVVLVTGASAGIGRAVAIGCARHGADVAINFGRDTAGAAAAVAAIEALGRKAVAIQGDVAEPATARGFVEGAEIGRAACRERVCQSV